MEADGTGLSSWSLVEEREKGLYEKGGSWSSVEVREDGLYEQVGDKIMMG